MIKIGKSSNTDSGKQIFEIIIETIINFIEANVLSKGIKHTSIDDKKQLLVIKSIRKKWEEKEKLFNDSPKKFLKQFLQESCENMDENQKAENIAVFLRVSQGIQASKMMEILGSSDKMNILILSKYIQTFNFKNMEVLFALRLLFSNFLMFGESQMIERVLEEFVNHYLKSNNVNFVLNHFSLLKLGWSLQIKQCTLYIYLLFNFNKH